MPAERCRIRRWQVDAGSHSHAAKCSPKVQFCDDNGVFERQERSSHPQGAVENERNAGSVVRFGHAVIV